MEYQPPIGGAADDPYVDANPGIGLEGSAVPAAAIEAPQREIIAVIEEAGLTPDADDNEQLLAAIEALIAASTPADVAYLGVVQAFTKAQRYDDFQLAIVTGNVAWNLDDKPSARLTLTSSPTMSAPTNQRVNGYFAVEFNTGAGGFAVAWDGVFDFGAEGTPIVPTGAGKTAIYIFKSDAASMRCVGRWNN